MAVPNYYDGHEALRGIWGASPDSVPRGWANNAVNRFFREDFNRTRPLIRQIVLEFENEEERIWFEGANGQGATFYNSYPSYVTPVLVCSIGGRIFTITIEGKTGTVRKLYDGNSRVYLHAWFAQGFQWLVIQDGIHPPLFWNGNPNDAPIRSDIAKNQMPIGSVMAFIHGRFVVASSDGNNAIYVGDIAYGETLTKPDDILNFTERTYWAEGGNFNTPAFLGNIMGLYAMPFIDTGTGQNELVVGCAGGFTSLDLSLPREQWVNTQVQRVALIGDGLVSSHGFAGLNGDMFFRCQSGISAYRNARVEYSQRWNQTPVSREVNYWIKPDRTDLLGNIPMVSWENMVITGCSPQIRPPNNPGFGYHRFCRGMVVFDADSMSTAGRDGAPVWHGQWSGIRPWAFAQGQIGNARRCFAFSFDRDGRNRLYEFTLQQGNDLFGQQESKIFSYYTTESFGSVETVTNEFQPKKLNGGMIELSELLKSSNIDVQYRPDGSPCWVDIAHLEPGCDCPTLPASCNLTAAPQWARKYFQAPNNLTCIPGQPLQTADTFRYCQVKVRGFGSFNVERLNIRFILVPDAQIVECLGNNCLPIDCCSTEDDYRYHIAPEGTNDEVPVIPGVLPVQFVSTRLARVCCPSFPSLCVTASGQATSLISQQDADTKAQAAAQQNAQAQLNCPDCTPSTEADQFVSEGEVVDYSGYFATGLYGGLEGQPWRLLDVLVEDPSALIAAGVVNATGTLETFTVYNSDFDPVTNVYTDTSPGSARIMLQRGCNTGGVPTWPSVDPYY